MKPAVALKHGSYSAYGNRFEIRRCIANSTPFDLSLPLTTLAPEGEMLAEKASTPRTRRQQRIDISFVSATALYALLFLTRRGLPPFR